MAKGKPNELRLVRVYDAPVKLVWEVWTDPKHAANWWGPRGFTITTHSKDFRAGGTWKYTMHGPDGTDWPNITLFHEVEEYKKMVYDHGGNESQPPLFRVTVTFEEFKGKTVMDMTMSFESEAKAKEIAKFIKSAGGNGTWDRLAEYLEHEQKGLDPFYINRSFEAPIATMYQMWTEKKHFAHWLGPTGATMEILAGEIKAGEHIFYKMINADGSVMYGKVHYQELTPVTRLVYTQQFCDKDGNMSRHPHAPTWPAFMYTTVTLAEEGPNETRVTVKWEPFGDCTKEEIEMFVSARAGMTQGWTGSFDKLEDYLAKR